MEFTSREILPNTFMIHGPGSTSYLLVGDEEGIVVDTGFSEDNIQAYIQTLTEKEVSCCINTHGHFDHTGGNGYFKLAYMSAEALKTAAVPYDSLDERAYLLSYPINVVADGSVIGMKGRPLEVMEIPAHSPSSIAVLDRKNRILFTGDEIGDATLIWMSGGQPYIEDYVKNLERLTAREEEFDYILTGHGDRIYDKALLSDSLQNARRILNGDMGAPLQLTGREPADFHLPEPEYKREAVLGSSVIKFDSRYIKRGL